mmetsp:Transcript_27520/g.90238  ORF Transcript_27520/g.90238 Transcript_27520/m.90238 type:complete len:230 (-) Transcript_27520:313-1002(-)
MGRLVLGVAERDGAGGELVGQHADGVPVAGEPVLLAPVLGPPHLGRHVAVRADARAALGRLLCHARCEAHVDEPDVALLVDEQVLGLEVAVEHRRLVHVRYHADRLHHHEPDLVRRESLLGENELGEVARGHQVHDEDEELLVLEGVVQVDQQRVRERRHQVLLEPDLLAPRGAEAAPHHLLVHNLHRVPLAAVPLDHLEHLPEPSLAKHAQQPKVGQPRHHPLLRLEL